MVYLTGDIHGDINSILEFVDEKQLGANDTIVLLGDVGLNYFGNHEGDGKRKQRLNMTGVTFFASTGIMKKDLSL